jgi:hypothetical protein
MIAKLLVLGALPAAFAAVAPRSWEGHHSEAASSEAVESATSVAATWAPLTTSTVYATSTYTITSCGPTVTHCPLGTHGAVVVTEVVPVSTTVCPVADAKPTGTWGAWPKPPVSEDEAWGCSTTTSYTEDVYTVTSTVAPFPVTTWIPVTTLTTTELSTEYSTCVHTVTNATKPYVATTLIPLTTVTKEVVSTSYSECIHTVTNATSVYPVTSWGPAATYTACPVKPTGGEWPVKPTGTGGWLPEASATKPAGGAWPTASWTKTADATKAVVTAGAAQNFGASGAIKMLGAAAAAVALVL